MNIKAIKSFILEDRIKSFLLFSSASFIGAFIGIATLPFYAKHLMPAEFGIWTFVITFNAFIGSIIVLDLHSYFMIRYFSKDTNRDKLLSNLLSLSFIWSILSMCILMIFGFSIFNKVFTSIKFFPFIFIILFSNIGSCFFQFLLIVYRLENKPVHYFFLSIFQSLITALFAIIATIFSSQNIVGRLAGYTAGMILSSFLAFILLVNCYSFKFSLDKKLASASLRFSAPLVPYVIATLSLDFLDRFFLERYSTLKNLGLFGIANQINAASFLLLVTLIRVYEPSIVTWLNELNKKSLFSFFKKYNWILIFCSVLIILTAQFIISSLTNENYLDAPQIIVKMTPFFYLKSISVLLLTILVLQKKTLITMYISVFTLALYTIFGFYVIPSKGMDGLIFLKTILSVISCFSIFCLFRKDVFFIKIKWYILFSFIALTTLVIIFSN